MTGTGLPLDGVRVVEMTHMVMGPTCGMILAQLGAEVIKVEPPAGDKTRSSAAWESRSFRCSTGASAAWCSILRRPKIARPCIGCSTAPTCFWKIFAMAVRKAGARHRGTAAQASSSDRRRPQRFFLRPLRASPGARRGRADDVGACRDDRHPRQAAAGRLFRQRHHGRHVRRDRYPGCALPETRRQKDGAAIRIGLFENCLFLVAQHMVQHG